MLISWVSSAQYAECYDSDENSNSLDVHMIIANAMVRRHSLKPMSGRTLKDELNEHRAQGGMSAQKFEKQTNTS